jgi:excisionase family DNA binding protein
MARKNQDLFSFRAKVALLERKLTVGELAKQIGRTRETVSRAIHRGRFPAVQKLIREALSL